MNPNDSIQEEIERIQRQQKAMLRKISKRAVPMFTPPEIGLDRARDLEIRRLQELLDLE